MEEIEVFGNKIFWIAFSYMLAVLGSFPLNLPLLLIVFRYLWHDGDEKAVRYSKSWLLIKVYSMCFLLWVLYVVIREGGLKLE